MTILLKEAYNIYQILISFIDQKLPIKLSYKIMKITSILESEVTFYKNKFQELVNEFGLKDAEGKIVLEDNDTSIVLQPDKTEEFYKQYQELQEMTLEIDEFQFTL